MISYLNMSSGISCAYNPISRSRAVFSSFGHAQDIDIVALASVSSSSSSSSASAFASCYNLEFHYTSSLNAMKTSCTMMKPTAASLLSRPCSARLRGIVPLPPTLQLTPHVGPQPLSRHYWHTRSLNGSDHPTSKIVNSTNRKFSHKTRKRLADSKQADQNQPSWLERHPNAEVPLEGSVTEIDVPGSGSFPLYIFLFSQKVCVMLIIVQLQSLAKVGWWSLLTASHQPHTCRDNCPCKICLHPQTRQRQLESFEVC
jgi:hypothetical protein